MSSWSLVQRSLVPIQPPSQTRSCKRREDAASKELLIKSTMSCNGFMLGIVYGPRVPALSMAPTIVPPPHIGKVRTSMKPNGTLHYYPLHGPSNTATPAISQFLSSIATPFRYTTIPKLGFRAKEASPHPTLPPCPPQECHMSLPPAWTLPKEQGV